MKATSPPFDFVCKTFQPPDTTARCDDDADCNGSCEDNFNECGSLGNNGIKDEDKRDGDGDGPV